MTDFPRRGDNFRTLNGPPLTNAPARILRELILAPDGLDTEELALRLGLSDEVVIECAAALAEGAVLDFNLDPTVPDWSVGSVVADGVARRVAAGRGVELGDWIPAA